MIHGMAMYSCVVLRSTPQGAELSPACLLTSMCIWSLGEVLCFILLSI